MLPIIPGLSELVAIGRGGSALVYSATRNAVGDRVAVKVLNDSLSDPAAQRHFEREFESLQQLADVPGVVAILDSGVSVNGDPYLVMPLFEGGSAQSLVNEQSPMPWADAARLVVAASRAVDAAHLRGIWHRDIKPGNILLTATGRPFVADFGISKVLADATTTKGPSSLTPRFAAPEVLTGNHIAQSDVYSLAATFVAFVSGRAPFSDDEDASVVDIINQVLTSDPPDIAPHGVPQPVAELIRRAMSKNPDDRPQTPAALADQLQEHLADVTTIPSDFVDASSVPATPANVGVAADAPAPPTRITDDAAPAQSNQRTDEPSNSRRVLLLAAAGLGVVLLAGAWLFGLFGGSANETASVVAEVVPTAQVAAPTAPPPTATAAQPTATTVPTAVPTPAPTAVPEPVARTISIPADGSGDVATLQDAFDQLEEGDTLELGAGTHFLEEKARIEIPFTLVGAGPGLTTITVTADTTALDLRGEDITVSDLTVTGSHVLGEDEEAFALIQLVTAKNFTLHNVEVIGGSSYGLASFGFTTGTIASSEFTENAGGGMILLQQSDLNVINNVAARNQDNGFNWFEQAEGVAIGNVSIDNDTGGFLIQDQAEPRLVDNVADRNGLWGYGWIDQSSGSATGNVSTNNGVYGFAAQDTSEPTWRSNRATGSETNIANETTGDLRNEQGLVLQVNADGSGEAATLALALEQASVGTVIRLGPGFHVVDEQLTIPESVIVTGEGSGLTTIVTSATMPALRLENSSVLSEVAVMGTATVASRGTDSALVEVAGPKFAMHGVELTAESEWALQILGETTGLIVNSQLASAGDDALEIDDDAEVTVVKTTS